jgi:hypothetical protein
LLLLLLLLLHALLQKQLRGWGQLAVCVRLRLRLCVGLRLCLRVRLCVRLMNLARSSCFHTAARCDMIQVHG